MQIKNNLYSIGVANPTLKVFDIIMATKYGTTYNAYLIKTHKGIILIDTVHNSFSEQYFKNINKITNIKTIKYLIVNHCEPDHSGSIAKLISLNPNIEIYCSSASNIFLSEITNNKKLKIHVIKDQEELQLDNVTLKFYVAPMLHWPDSIFTLYKEQNILFTCDFLGCHYGKKHTFDIDLPKQDLQGYEHELKNYYDGIFGPFATAVKKGLSIINQIKPNIICPSHGPILTTKGFIEPNLNKYKKWSNIKVNDKLFPIFYVSAYGYTEKMAQVIKKEATKKGYKAKLYNVIDYPIDELAAIMNSVTKFAIGSPTLNHNALPPIWNLLGYLDANNAHNKQAIVFGSYGWSGESNNLITNYLTNLKVKVSDQSFKINFNSTKQDLIEIQKKIDIFLN